MNSVLSRITWSIALLALGFSAMAQNTPSPTTKPADAKMAAITPSGGQSPKPAQPTLTAGSPAPALKVAKWFKGDPIDSLKDGQIYVVEFWATWCGPCKVSIPHLTELAKKNAGKATFIGVSVYEHPSEPTNEAIFALVDPFVKEMGDQMQYNVAAEGADKTMGATWMEAAGQTGIPTAFIIGKDGKIQWIGHPMQMEKPLDEVIAGTFDLKAEIARQDKIIQDKAELTALLAPLEDALRAKDDKAVVVAVDKVLAVKPDMEPQLLPVRFNSLISYDEPGAYTYGRALLDAGYFTKQPVAAYNIASIIMSKAATLKNPDYKLVVSALEKAADAMKNTPPLEAALAEAYFRVGDTAKAIETEQKAIAHAEAATGVSPGWLEIQKKKLAEYQAKKN